MGVTNRQKRRRITGVFAVVISVVVVLFTRSVSDFNEAQVCKEWASVDALIPPVRSYDFDSSAWNTLEAPVFELDSNLNDEAYRIVSDENGITVFHGAEGDHRAQSTLGQLGMLGNEVALPWGEISDEPVFTHRGVLMEIGRAHV